MINSADPDQLASSEANWSGSTLFAKQGISGFSRTRVKILSLFLDWLSFYNQNIFWKSSQMLTLKVQFKFVANDILILILVFREYIL